MAIAKCISRHAVMASPEAAPDIAVETRPPID
jgi:hypothetical protein